MSKSTMIHARIEPALKHDAEQMLSELGLNMTQAITLFLQQVRLNRGLPFEVKLPTPQTQKALDELDKREGKKFSTIDDLFDDLEN
ncbi:MAG: type II toxin-antitoxin system RelB/DinJ family antitoxin [Sulfuricurvum sp.]|uniref:type II toxin-antitoxin system RelB/DinJ family antitoxin n=1 Tax=Sulfuricurvum sp. TaxID=2025608 RepID=UPI0025F790ED|nr:type II toxin-antitoxin system RelB/DinJ family antitoxin [Sulfuricurvum sp.]MCK9374242.1 type II toxin-antitoxin system RelB/DinJ family antitoxin [Sulfuricurvum sp.]